MFVATSGLVGRQPMGLPPPFARLSHDSSIESNRVLLQ
jgi:hypothetical protein